MKEKICIECHKKYKPKHYRTSKYCSHKCQKEYQSKLLIEQWKNGEHKGWTGKTIKLSNFIRNYILKKYNYKCSICGWSKKHPITNKTPLDINHIDGNPKNCKENNLEVLCPNCHSLTPNYKALNKKSPRNR